MPILNYTTTVDPHKTVTEIMRLLTRKGGVNCRISYKGTEPDGIEFELLVKDVCHQFRLPSRVGGVLRALKRNPKVPAKSKTEEQARRVAWRILKDWVAAQMALVESEVSPMEEVFLPYLLMDGQKTLGENFIEKGLPKQLTVGGVR